MVNILYFMMTICGSNSETIKLDKDLLCSEEVSISPYLEFGRSTRTDFIVQIEISVSMDRLLLYQPRLELESEF